jgi:hypothetical protein
MLAAAPARRKENVQWKEEEGADQVLVGAPRRGDLGRLGEPSLPPMKIAFAKPDLRPEEERTEANKGNEE